jgi:hypothetical protein
MNSLNDTTNKYKSLHFDNTEQLFAKFFILGTPNFNSGS